MPEIKNWTYGIYDVIELTDLKRGAHLLCKCKCRECGMEFYKRLTDINNQIKVPQKCNHYTKTGHIIDYKFIWQNKRIGSIFNGMKDRCYNESCKCYNIYGGKGIKVFEGWLCNPKSFEEWSLSHGYQDNLTIDRIDSNKDYCPENCRWVSKSENSRWQNNTYRIVVNGILKSGTQWALYLHHGRNYITKMINDHGMEYTITFIEEQLKNDSYQLESNS